MVAYILNEKEPPNKVPTVNKVVGLIASLGVFLVEKGRWRTGCQNNLAGNGTSGFFAV